MKSSSKRLRLSTLICFDHSINKEIKIFMVIYVVNTIIIRQPAIKSLLKKTRVSTYDYLRRSYSIYMRIIFWNICF